MARLFGERRLDEHFRESDSFLDGVLARAEAEHVRVVVQPGEPGGLVAPRDRSPDAPDLVGAICSPLPEPPITIPRLPGSPTAALAARMT